MQPFLAAALAATALTLVPPAPARPVLPAPSPQEAVGDAARLLPSDAVFVLRLDSTQALVTLLNRLSAAAGEDEGSPAKLLAGLELPGDAALVDAAGPVWMAVSASAETMRPSVTFVVTPREAEAYRRSVEDEGGWTVAADGGLVGLSQTAGYAAGEPSALAARMRPGLASMHIDLATLIETFRPFIEMGLDKAEMQMSALADMAAGGMDIGALLELYIDLAWDFVDSAEALDVTLVQRGSALELASFLTTLEGSPMAAWGEGAPVDLSGWPAQVDPGATLSAAIGGDWATIMKRAKPLLDASFSVYPDETGTFLKEYMAACEPLFPLMGPTFMGGDLGKSGMRMGYVVRSEKPQELIDGMGAVAERFAGGDTAMGIGVSAPETVELGGVKALRYRMQIDYDAMAASMGEELGEAQRAQMRDAMAALYGEDGMTITLAPADQALVAAFGGGDEFAQRVLTAPAGAARGVPADLQRALAAASGGSMALVYRFDLGKLMEEIGELASAFSGGEADLGELPGGPMPVTLWGSIGGRSWSGGSSVDLDALVAFVEALSEDEAGAFGFEESELEEPPTEAALMPAGTREAIVQAEMALIEATLELFAINNGGRYPDSLELLVMPDENGESYLDELPVDPWGHAYLYESPTEDRPAWRLVCTGADGAPGGEGEAADVVLTGSGH